MPIFNGGRIGSNNDPTTSLASGLWTGLEQCDAVRREIWTGLVPPIVTDGLVLHLDAGNSASYPGSDTTWFDLTTNSNNGTISGATYSSNESGYLDFDGVNDYVNFASNTLTSAATEISCFLWVYPVSDGNILSILGQSSINTSYHHSAIEIGSSGQLRMSLWHSSLTNRVTSTLSFNTWNNIGFTYSGTTLTGYVNGSSVGTTTLTWSKPTNLYFGIMATDSTDMGTSAYGDGNVSAFYTYNKALTSSEVTQNYNALKGRYGL